MPLDIPVLDAAETRARLAEISPGQLLDHLRTAFAGLKSGTSVQPATAITDYPDNEGDCVFLSGLMWDLDLLGVKVSPLSQHRARQGQNPVTAYTMLLSARGGEPIMLCDSMALTAARTGATTALGVDYLAGKDASSLFVFGAGPVAVEHIRHVAELRKWVDVCVYSPALSDPSSQRHSSFQNQKAELENLLGCSVTVVSDTTRAGQADVVMCCTSANYPLLRVDDLKRGALVTSVTSDIKPAHEVDPADLTAFAVYCDYTPTATVKSWEMKEAAAQHGWSFDSIVADLSELATDDTPIDPKPRKYFRNHGLAIEDLVIAGLIAKQL